MAGKKSQTRTAKRKSPKRRLFNMMLVVASLGKFVQEMIGVIGTRTREAGQSLFALLVLAFLFASLLTVVWLSLLGILFIYLISLDCSALCAITSIAVINAVLLVLVIYLIRRAKEHLTTSLRPR